MKKINLIANIVIVILLVISIAGFIISYNYANKPIPEIKFETEPEYDELTKSFAYISGAIQNPGVYEIYENTRIIDLTDLAGGFSNEVDKEFINQDINLSKIVDDEEHVFIPFQDSFVVVDANTTVAENEANDNLININGASKDELISLPNIGPVTAEKIIGNRPYNTVEELLDVEGIGEKTFEAIKDLISI